MESPKRKKWSSQAKLAYVAKWPELEGTTKGETTADSRALLECKNDKQVKVKMQRTSWTDCHAEPWAGHGASDFGKPSGWLLLRRGGGPGGTSRAREKLSQGVPKWKPKT